MNPVFSIVLVSRNRPQMLTNLLESIKQTAELPYEVLIGFDDDDSTVRDLICQIQSDNILTFVRPRMKNLHVYLNLLAKKSRGEYVFGLNDDCLIHNKWMLETKKILDKFGETHYNCSYAKTYDNSLDKISPDYSAFPIISRAAINRLGFFMDESCQAHGADVRTYMIYKKAGLVVNVPVQIRHLLHESELSLAQYRLEKTATEMVSRTLEEGNLYSLFNYDVDLFVDKLTRIE